MRKSKNYFIDTTFHHPPDFKQMLIFMYKDIITELKIPGIYIIKNSKNEQLYDIIFLCIYNLLTLNNSIDLKFKQLFQFKYKLLSIA